jgi:hypothetical protein
MVTLLRWTKTIIFTLTSLFGGVATMWIYDLNIFHNTFYNKALQVYRNNQIYIVATPPIILKTYNRHSAPLF